jgi:outer membrane protein assembly factor BamB
MRIFGVVVAVFLGLSGAGAVADDWSQWRGPHRDGRSAGAPWPGSLDHLETLWEVPLGKGYPGPIVTRDRVFVVETIDSGTVAVRALSRTDGEVLWSSSWGAGGKVPFFAAANGDWVRSTPAWDGETLYVGDMEERLVALDGASGETRWTVDFPERFETKIPDFGFASSPLVEGDAVYVQAANSLVKVDRRTGEILWRSLVGSGKIQASGAFSSPVIHELAGLRQLVVQARHTLFGVNLEDGSELWSVDVPNFRGMNILTPVFVGNRIFTSTYRNGSFMFEVKRSEDRFSIEETWKHPASGYMSSPVVIDGYIYLHLGNGRVTCLDAEDGTEQWRSQSFGKYWSMAWQDGKILALDEGGDLVLLNANPQAFEVLGVKEVTEREAWGYLAIRGDELFIRDLESVRALRWTDRTDQPSARMKQRQTRTVTPASQFR